MKANIVECLGKSQDKELGDVLVSRMVQIVWHREQSDRTDSHREHKKSLGTVMLRQFL